MSKEEIPNGTVVEFLQDQKIQTGVVIGSKNQRLLILTENNREINISKSRLLEALGPELNASNRSEIVTKLQEIGHHRQEIAKKIDVEELWNFLEGEGGEFTARELAEFIYNDPEVHEIAAVQRAILQNKLFFQYKGGVFIPRSKENVEQKIIQAKREAEKEQKLQVGVEWLRSVFPKVQKKGIPEEVKDIVSRIQDFALHGTNSIHYPFIKELFKRAEINLDPQLALKILINIGVWKEDENILIYQYDIPRNFSREAQEFVGKLEKKQEHVDPLDEYRKDLSNIPAITIDGEETKDIDDALSIEKLDDNTYRVGVHITDVSSYIKNNDPLDKEARSRMTSIYLPDEKIPMLPPTISEGLCSLIANQIKRTISFIFTVDPEGNILATEVLPTFIEVKERLTYEQANALIEKREDLKTLYELSQKLQQQRQEKGALIMHVPEVQAIVREDGSIYLKRYDQDMPAQTTVSEWMIAANAFMASFFIKNEIPAIYRCQGEPREEDIPYASEHPLFYLCHKRRMLSRAELSVEPNKHCSLGLDCYVSITSPIRRYTDLVLQRQYRHFLTTGKPLYSLEELDSLITEMNAILPKVSFLSRKWNRYWIFKYLKQAKVQKCEALVLDQNERVINVILPEYMLEASILKKNIQDIRVGQIIPVKIEKINPREDILRLQVL